MQSSQTWARAVESNFFLHYSQIWARADESIEGGDQLKTARFYATTAVVGTCHDFSSGRSGHRLIRSLLQVLCQR